jgi:parallel beta-helix repeat protein
LIDLLVIRLKWWFLIVVYWEEDLRSNVAFLLVLLLSGASVAVFDVEPFVRGSAIIRVPQDYPTIKAATSAAAAGDTIVVSEGVYAEGQINIGKSLTLEANGTVVVDGLQMGHVFYVWANYVTIRGFTIQNSNKTVYPYCGVCLESSEGSLIEGNVITNSYIGIRGDAAFSSVISNNVIMNNSWRGIYLFGSADNLIVSNKVVNNNITGIMVYWWGGFNAIVDNFVANHSVGIGQGYGAGPSTISGNTIVGNAYGIAFANSYGNKVFHNNFINNTQQALSKDDECDDGYPSGGNYWSDYTGVDFCSGPYQNETGSDGIGDAEYVIPLYVRDDYPLMKPFPWSAHDIALTKLATSKTVVGEGSDLKISLMAFNYGNSTENFNITMYINTTIIETREVTLTNRNSTTITFTWNTTGFIKGNYTISAQAEPVSGENDLSDNTLECWVILTIPGDTNGDKTVNFLDAILLGTAFNSEPDDPNWNPNSDINGDNVINFLDAIILGVHFGQSWT